MEPISPQHYKGNSYIQLETLPEKQKDQLSDWLPATEILKLKVDQRTIDHCVNYQDYLFWYENHYDQNNSYESEI